MAGMQSLIPSVMALQYKPSLQSGSVRHARKHSLRSPIGQQRPPGPHLASSLQ